MNTAASETEKLIDENSIEGNEAPGTAAGEVFDNLLAVLEYLKHGGWKAARQSLYRHHDQGKIVAEPDGRFKQRIVDKYAKTFLKQVATGKTVSKNMGDLQRKKLEHELESVRLKNEREQFNYDKDRGLYIPRAQMEIEVAARAGVLLAGLRHWITSNAADWIELVGGDVKKVGELINKMGNDLDDHVNIYAGAVEFEAVIEGDPEDINNAEQAGDYNGN